MQLTEIRSAVHCVHTAQNRWLKLRFVRFQCMKINSEISAATAAVVMRMVDAKHKEIKGDGDGDGGGGFSCQLPTNVDQREIAKFNVHKENCGKKKAN